MEQWGCGSRLRPGSVHKPRFSLLWDKLEPRLWAPVLSAPPHRKAVREPAHIQIKDHRFLWLEGALRDSPFATFISWGSEGKREECWIVVNYRDPERLGWG